LSLKFGSYDEASAEIGVSSGVLTRAVIDGCIPKPYNSDLVCSYFGIPSHILFNVSDILKRKSLLIIYTPLIINGFTCCGSRFYFPILFSVPKYIF
jgi:hypothetical protein